MVGPRCWSQLGLSPGPSVPGRGFWDGTVRMCLLAGCEGQVHGAQAWLLAGSGARGTGMVLIPQAPRSYIDFGVRDMGPSLALGTGCRRGSCRGRRQPPGAREQALKGEQGGPGVAGKWGQVRVSQTGHVTGGSGGV